MQLTRFVRTLVPFVMLGLAGCLVGCSGEGVSTPLDPVTVKKVGAAFKQDRQEAKAARQGSKASAKRKCADAPVNKDADGGPAAPEGGTGPEEKK